PVTARELFPVTARKVVMSGSTNAKRQA
ncbi:MAG: hypothetical protein QOC61_1171, partial [Acidobacteriota bacterium]|nr:hypothetical protein [Acidobacteriota bacterium]